MIKKYQENSIKYGRKFKSLFQKVFNNETVYNDKYIKIFNNETVYNDKYIKTKIKIYNDRVYTNCRDDKIPKRQLMLNMFTCNVIHVNSDKKYYPKVFLEYCKYAVKTKYIYIYIYINIYVYIYN